MTTPLLVGAVAIISGTLLVARSTIHLDAPFQQNTVEFQGALTSCFTRVSHNAPQPTLPPKSSFPLLS